MHTASNIFKNQRGQNIIKIFIKYYAHKKYIVYTVKQKSTPGARKS